MNKLLNQIKNKKIILGVVGLGNVGLNLLLKASKNDIPTFGIDVDQKKITTLKEGKSYLSYVSNQEISQLKEAFFSTDYSHLKKCDIVCLCLPTDFNNQPELGSFFKAFNETLHFIKTNTLLIIESTLPPLTTENELLPLISKSFSLGSDLFLGICPERINPGKKEEYLQSETRVFSGFDRTSKELTKTFYESIGLKTHEVSTLKAAEFTKLYENAYRAINIVFADQMQNLANEAGIDIHEVIEASSTKGLGFHPHFPSSGIGGGCIPMSLEYLQFLGEKLNLTSDIIESALKNSKDKTSDIARTISKRIKNGNNRVLFLGASYKKNIGDLKRSPTLQIINLLDRKLFSIAICDPFLQKDIFTDEINFIQNFNELDFDHYELIVLMTEHDDFNLKTLKEIRSKIIDPKGLLSSV